MNQAVSRPEQSSPLFSFMITMGGGLLTSLIAAYISLLIFEYGDLSFYTYMVWGVVPIGAIILGVLAASGYYGGASLMHYQPSAPLLVAMVILGAGTQVLIYFLEYSNGMDERGRYFNEIETFIPYIKDTLENAVYIISSKHGDDPIVLEGLGTVMAGIQMIAFMASSVMCFISLVQKPACKKCRKYYRQVGKTTCSFDTMVAFGHFENRLSGFAPFSKPFMDFINDWPEKGPKDDGSVHATYTLFTCPGCDKEVFEQTAKLIGQRDRPIEDATRRSAVPEGQSLKSYFEK